MDAARVSTCMEVGTLAIESTQSGSGLVRRVHADGRRVFEWEAKLAIVREATKPGVSLAGVALRHGVNANLLRKWVVKHRAQALGATETATLLPVVMTPSSAPTTRSSQAKPRERTAIEVECVRGVARFDDGIDRAVLRELIEAMSAR